MASTIKDVAELAGYSIATVSRVVNGSATVSALTQERIQTAIEVLQFRPNYLGRQLRARHTRMIGVVLPTLANPVFAECMQGIDEMASAAGYRIILATTQYDAVRERQAVETLLNQRVDGLIVTVTNAESSALLDELDDEATPYVLAYNDTPHRPSVSVNNRAAAQDGVRLLIQHGHTRITMLTGHLAASDRAHQRYLGYSDAMREAGLAPRPALEVDFNLKQLDPQILHALTQSPDHPSALFCSNDLLAMTVMRALRETGPGLPTLMSIVGFDGLAVGELLSPPLTTVCQPNHEIGVQSWLQLHARIQGGTTSLALVLPHCIRAGGTVDFYTL